MSSEYTCNAPQLYADLTEVEISDDGHFFDANEAKEKDGGVLQDDKENGLLSDSKEERAVLKEVGVSRDSVQQHAGKKRKSCDNPGTSSVSKYRSLAESIYHFQMDTPPRFRGVSKKSSGLSLSTVPVINPTRTVPETFRFISDQRLRHYSHNCLSHEERELQEIEEAKQRFKPQQLNKQIFEPPKEVDREKQFTIPKPFRLTNPPKKPVQEKEVYVFKARPLPLKIYRDCLRVSTNRLPVLMEEEMKEIDHGFKARPAAVLTKKPFQVRKSDRGTTKFLDLKLNTEIRAQQRQVYEVHRKFIQAEREQMESKEEVAKRKLPVPKAVYNDNKTSSQSLNEHSE